MWKEVERWFKLCHEWRLDISLFGNPGYMEDVAAEYSFQVVMEMRDLPWENTKKVLKLFKASSEEVSTFDTPLAQEWN